MHPRQSDRRFLKSDRWQEWEDSPTDQRRGLPQPPLEKPCAEGARLIDLVPPEQIQVEPVSLMEAIGRRRSVRRYANEALTLAELSFLAWATQGVVETFRDGVGSRRTVPSAGARHPFETYLLAHRVEGLEVGLYRYLPMGHRLCHLYSDAELPAKMAVACHGQRFVRDAAAVFVWTVIPYRTEWRYTVVSPKLIALDAGHVCQNLYLACEAIGAGTCAIGAYEQEVVDPILGVDGEDEFAVYLATVGKTRK